MCFGLWGLQRTLAVCKPCGECMRMCTSEPQRGSTQLRGFTGPACKSLGSLCLLRAWRPVLPSCRLCHFAASRVVVSQTASDSQSLSPQMSSVLQARASRPASTGAGRIRGRGPSGSEAQVTQGSSPSSKDNEGDNESWVKIKDSRM